MTYGAIVDSYIWSMFKIENRPILIYFVVIFGSAAFAMSGTYGWMALLWALLVTLLFGVSIPAPLFLWKYVQRKEIRKPLPVMLGAYGASYVILSLIFMPATGSILGGVFMGVLYYGFPGTLLALLGFKFLRR